MRLGLSVLLEYAATMCIVYPESFGILLIYWYGIVVRHVIALAGKPLSHEGP